MKGRRFVMESENKGKGKKKDGKKSEDPSNEGNTPKTKSRGFFSFFHGKSSEETKKPLVAQPGLCGLGNLGNTCFMNSALQCLSNTPQLNVYFSSGEYKKDINKRNPIGMKGQLADAFGDLMKRMWSGEYKTLSPRSFKRTLGRWAPQFSGFSQNDSQELLSFLLDGLHEDTNKISKKPYVETVEGDGTRPDDEIAQEAWKAHLKRNKSLIVDLFQGQLKSTVTCSVCHHKSVKFDPFMFLSLPLPNGSTKPIEAIVVRYKGSAKKIPVRYAVNAPRYGSVDDVKKLLSPLCGIPESKLALAYLGEGNRIIQRFVSSAVSLSSLISKDVLFFYELPVINKAVNTQKSAQKTKKSKHKEEDKEEDKTVYRVCFVHRIESVKKKGTYRLKGLPFAIDFAEGDECNKLYEAVWKKYKFLLGKAAKKPPFSSYEGYERDEEEEEMHECHAKNKSMKREYPFVISCVSYMGISCGICKTGCSGCHVKCSKKIIPWDEYVHYGKIAFMSVDWCVPCINSLSINLNLLGCVSLHESCLAIREKQSRSISLDDCMQLFSSEEHLGKDDLWYCPHCKEHREAFKKMDIWKLPEILVVHLKRFQYTTTRREKLNVNVEFKTKWDLKPFVLGNNKDGSNMRYEMYAGSYHMGGLGGGHYIAYAKNNENNQWYCFNDSRCSKADESEIHSGAAYVLFYKRMNKEIESDESEDNDESESSGDSDNSDSNEKSKPKGSPEVKIRSKKDKKNMKESSNESESENDDNSNDDSSEENSKPRGDPKVKDRSKKGKKKAKESSDESENDDNSSDDSNEENSKPKGGPKAKDLSKKNKKKMNESSNSESENDDDSSEQKKKHEGRKKKRKNSYDNSKEEESSGSSNSDDSESEEEKISTKKSGHKNDRSSSSSSSSKSEKRSSKVDIEVEDSSEKNSSSDEY